DDVRAIVVDWSAMRDKMQEVADDLANRKLPASVSGREEAQAFLRWAADEHFTFLGYRHYDVVKRGGEEVLVANEDTGLGLLRGKDPGRPRKLKTLAAHYMPQSGSVDALILTKTMRGPRCIARATWTTSACSSSTRPATRSPNSASWACTP